MEETVGHARKTDARGKTETGLLKEGDGVSEGERWRIVEREGAWPLKGTVLCV